MSHLSIIASDYRNKKAKSIFHRANVESSLQCFVGGQTQATLQRRPGMSSLGHAVFCFVGSWIAYDFIRVTEISISTRTYTDGFMRQSFKARYLLPLSSSTLARKRGNTGPKTIKPRKSLPRHLFYSPTSRSFSQTFCHSITTVGQSFQQRACIGNSDHYGDGQWLSVVASV